VNVEHLVTMANQIGRFYEAYPDKAEAHKSAVTHVRRFWDPRMRKALLHHIDTEGGEGLSPFMLEALRVHAQDWTPAGQAPRP
jgi:formate dehydrogenase subunit delta